jgi:hypothetical protein
MRTAPTAGTEETTEFAEAPCDPTAKRESAAKATAPNWVEAFARVRIFLALQLDSIPTWFKKADFDP